jgi:hypothetical protein
LARAQLESAAAAPMGTVSESEYSGPDGALAAAVTADAPPPADYNLFKFSLAIPVTVASESLA